MEAPGQLPSLPSPKSGTDVDIISCWSLLYGVYDGGGGE